MGCAFVILEAILGVSDTHDKPRFAPMGVTVMDDKAKERVFIRPFSSSKTGALLLKKGCGVLNFSDDVFLFALTALTDISPAACGAVLDDVCYWWEITVDGAKKDGAADRWDIECRVAAKKMVRPFSPFNRGKHAVLEAAILASRVYLMQKPRAHLTASIKELEKIVIKTGGERELEAFDLIQSILG